MSDSCWPPKPPVIAASGKPVVDMARLSFLELMRLAQDDRSPYQRAAHKYMNEHVYIAANDMGEGT